MPQHLTMSMKRLGLMVAVSSGLGPTQNITTPTSSARAGSSLHGNVNVLLGGAMLSGVILVVFLICYCCHRNMRKSATRNAQYWHDEPEVPLEVFTVDGQCYEVAGVFLSSESCASYDTYTCPETPSPPPAYEIVVNEDSKGKQAEVDLEKIEVTIEKIDENSGLPSYEAALRFEAHGYV